MASQHHKPNFTVMLNLSHCHAQPVHSVHITTVECHKQNLVQLISEAGVGLPWAG